MSNKAIHKKCWRNIIFFGIITAGALIGAPLYLWKHGFHSSDWILFLIYALATGMSITVGYHRLYAHRTFEAHPILHFFALFFGAAAFEQSVLDWSSQHRDHHRYVDTPEDPYSIKKGFFYAHIGWLLFWQHVIDHSNVKDLASNRWINNQAKYYYAWCLISGIITPLFFGVLFGNIWGALWIGICLRIFLIHHSTFFINSVCHRFGAATYDPESTAKDHWFIAFLTNGEGYHNFHHRFPGDYRNGILWYQWDPSKWFIRLSSFLGLAYDLKRVPSSVIFQAKQTADLKRESMRLKRV